MTDERYKFREARKENAGLSVYSAGYEKCDRNHSWGPGVRDHYLIHFVSSGRGVFRYNKQEYSIGAGELFIIHPSQLAAYQADAEEPWQYIWVGFNGTDARRLVNLTGFSQQEPVLVSNDPETTQTLMHRIAEASGSTAAADAEMVGCLYQFLAHLIRMHGQHTTENPHQTYVASALRYIQYNLANDVSVSDIARFVGISRSQLYRAFLQDFGVSPHHYLQTYRINEACSLLHKPGYSVAEVAGSVGFNDPLYFSRVFKSIKGCTPTEYQRNKAF